MNAVPQDLKVAYTRSAQKKSVTLNKLWENAVLQNWSSRAVTPLLDLSFQIKCSGGIYGYPALSSAAEKMHKVLVEAELSNLRLSELDDARRDLDEQLAFVAHEIHVSQDNKEHPLNRYDAIRRAGGNNRQTTAFT